MWISFIYLKKDKTMTSLVECIVTYVSKVVWVLLYAL